MLKTILIVVTVIAVITGVVAYAVTQMIIRDIVE